MPTRVFFDETSAIKKFTDLESFKKGVLILDKVSRKVEDIKSKHGAIEFLTNKNISNIEFIDGKTMSILLGQISKEDKQLYVVFKGLIAGKLGYWNDNAAQSANSDYTTFGNRVNETSLAETWDREITSYSCFIFSFPHNDLGTNTPITIEKDTSPKNIERFFDFSGFQGKIISTYIKNYFDKSYPRFPDDRETVLSNTELWTPTRQKVKGATIYVSNCGTEVAYVDTLHKNGDQHLELFERKSRTHLGSMEYDGTLIPNSRKSQYDNKIPKV